MKRKISSKSQSLHGQRRPKKAKKRKQLEPHQQPKQPENFEGLDDSEPDEPREDEPKWVTKWHRKIPITRIRRDDLYGTLCSVFGDIHILLFFEMIKQVHRKKGLAILKKNDLFESLYIACAHWILNAHKNLQRDNEARARHLKDGQREAYSAYPLRYLGFSMTNINQACEIIPKAKKEKLIGEEQWRRRVWDKYVYPQLISCEEKADEGSSSTD